MLLRRDLGGKGTPDRIKFNLQRQLTVVEVEVPGLDQQNYVVKVPVGAAVGMAHQENVATEMVILAAASMGDMAEVHQETRN